MICLWHRCWLWCHLVGRVTPAGVGRLSPRLAWEVVRILIPKESL